jgi:serpin B
LVAGNTAFAFDLYQAVRSTGDNLVFSPYSVSLAFAMAYGGSRAETAAQMAAVLHYTLPESQFHPAFNALDLDLAARPGQAVAVPEDEKFELSIANALWLQEDWPFLPEYLDLLAVNYGAGLRLVDFEHSPGSARKQINDWVSDQTHKRIRDIVPPGAFDSNTKMALANAIYFKATWEHKFDPDSSTGLFYLLDGEEVEVEMMGQEHEQNFTYASGDGWQAIALPYSGGLADMVILIPDTGNFDAFESALDADGYTGIIAALQPQMVLLSMPKFTFESSYNLGDSLAQMGMPLAFDRDLADFSGMDGQHLLFIQNVLHKAFIAVDEKGTEAAASTIIFMGLGALMPQGIILRIDRPFLYFIRDVPTGTILFMGRVLNPQ